MKKILLSIFSVIMIFMVIVAPAYAEEKCVLTSVLGGSACDEKGNKIHDVSAEAPLESGEFSCSCEGGDGSSIMHILNLVVDIMTIGIGILGVIGISVVGIQYLTAGGSEEKTRKAKRRMLEIIIGLAVYAVIFALLKFLLPGFQGP